MRLAAGIIVFNDRLSLMRTLSSLTECDYVFVVDGKFPDFDYPSQLSDDGTRDICEEFDNVILIDCPGPEVDKRNRYLQACHDYNIDYLIPIDSDEWVIDTDWIKFRRNCEDLPNNQNIFGLSCRYDGVNFGVYPRLWRAPAEMEYYRCHNFFRHKPTGNVFRSPSNAPLVEGIKLAWDDSLRKKEWIDKTYQYQVKLIEKEKPIKRQLLDGSSP